MNEHDYSLFEENSMMSAFSNDILPHNALGNYE